MTNETDGRKPEPIDEFATTAKLLDGSQVTIRRLGPDDYDAVVALAADLSAEEQYFRFFTAHPVYIGEWARSLTDPAPDFVALGAFESREVIGVANYVEVAQQPGCAEIAVVVAHEQHARGVGTALLKDLGRIGRGAGLHRFVADMLAENYMMRRVITDAGWPVTFHRDGSVFSIEVNLDTLEEGT